MTKAIVLFSGGLDSLVTALALRRLGIEIVPLNVVTPLHNVSEEAQARADAHGLDLLVRHVDADYADLIVHPKWGYGSAVNPCVDCRVVMLKIAKQVMAEQNADFIATGEVVGQRPNSQKMHQLALIAREADVIDCIVRPLSAHAMNPSKVERNGLLDREKLYGFTGRGRTGLMQVAEELGVREIPQPASGCLLCEKTFAPRVRDVIKHNPHPTNWHFEVLPFGRVVRIDPEAQCIVARNQPECRKLVQLFECDDRPRAALYEPDNFFGPAMLLIGEHYDEHHERIAGGQLLRFANPDRYDANNAIVRFRDAMYDERRQIFPDANAETYQHY